MATKNVANDDIADNKFLAAQQFKAVISTADLSKLEKCAKDFGVNRRVMQAILAADKDELLARVKDPEESAETFLKMLDMTKDYREHLAGLLEQVDAAEARILCMAASLIENNPEPESNKAA